VNRQSVFPPFLLWGRKEAKKIQPFKNLNERKIDLMKKILLVFFILLPFLLVSQAYSASAKMAPGPSKDPITGKTYAGSEKCKTCHKAQYDSWKNTIHAWMIRPIAKGDFKNVKADLTVEGAPKPEQYD
jgi:hypothetical protein